MSNRADNHNGVGADMVPRLFVALSEWIALSAYLENNQAVDDGARLEARSAYVGRSARIAAFIGERLLLENESDGQSGGVSCVLEAKDIVMENFEVELSGAASIEVEDMKKSIELLSSALENVTKVRIKESPKHHIGGQSRSDILQKLGILLYQVFSRGSVAPPSYKESEKGNGLNLNPADEVVIQEKPKRIEELDGEDDEEQPGAEKGRQRRLIVDTSKSFRRVHISHLEDTLANLCLPASISTLLKDLIEPDVDNVHAFQSLKDTLDFGDIIVGRTDEVRALLEVAAMAEIADDDPTQQQNLVMIGGHAGSGKTHLVESVAGSLTENDWIFLGCKFDRLRQAQPLSTISSAFEKFFQQIISVQNELDEVGGILLSIRNSLSASGIVVLSELMPSLCTLYPAIFASIIMDDCSQSSDECSIQDDSNEVTCSTNDILHESNMDEEVISSAGGFKNRMHFLFRVLLHAISSPEHHVLFFLDDLQWIDESSIQLLSSLITDTNDGGSHCSLIVGSYCTNEVDESHILAPYLRRFEEEVNCRHIYLDAVTKSDANILVSAALQLPVRQLGGLADQLYLKSLGNPLFLKSLMKLLVEEKVLCYSLVKRCWIWDIAAVSSVAIDENVAELLARKLSRMPEDIQKALKIASCFGLQVEEGSLQLLSLSNNMFCDLTTSLDQALQEGIVEKEGRCYKLAHDTLHQVIYESMHQEEKGQYHFTIGVILATHILSESQHNHSLMFVAANQINIAKSLLTDSWGGELMHDEFAKLNLMAGERSIELSDFSSSVHYLENGIAFLPETTPWESHYGLSLRLFDSLCLASYVACPDRTKILLEEIFKHAKSSEDRLKAYFILVQLLTLTGGISASIDKIFDILEQLGEKPFPTEATPDAVKDVMVKAKKLSSEFSNAYFLAAPRIENEKKHWAVKLMTYIAPYINMAKPGLLPFIACRIVEIMVEFGVCSEASFGLLVYGDCHINQKDIEEGYRLGQLGKALLRNRFGATNLYPRMNVRCAFNNFCWVDRIQSTASSLHESYREALLVGDNETAYFGAISGCNQDIFCGRLLPAISRECAALALEMKHLNQVAPCLPHLSNHQLVLALLGSKQNPFHLMDGLFNNEDDVYDHSLSTGRAALASLIVHNRLCRAFLLKKYKDAAKYAARYKHQGMMLHNAFALFYSGLTAFHFVRCATDELEWMEMAENALASYRFFVRHSTWNWENKLLLLEAECCFSKGEMDKAEEYYKDAIESARRHRFVHEQGLANDLFAVFHLANGKADRAKVHISHFRSPCLL